MPLAISHPSLRLLRMHVGSHRLSRKAAEKRSLRFPFHQFQRWLHFWNNHTSREILWRKTHPVTDTMYYGPNGHLDSPRSHVAQIKLSDVLLRTLWTHLKSKIVIAAMQTSLSVKLGVGSNPFCAVDLNLYLAQE